jgi:hypothetical protein
MGGTCRRNCKIKMRTKILVIHVDRNIMTILDFKEVL